MHLVATCILLCLAGQEALGIRILGLFPVPVKSHLMVTSSVMHALAKKGHDVTMFVPFHTGYNASNFKEITYNPVPISNQVDILKYSHTNFLIKQFGFYFMGLKTTEMALDTPEAKALMKSDEKFDIIVLEEFVNEAFFAYVHKFKCPVVLISTFGTTAAINGIFGNSAPYSYVPSEFVSFDDRMTFLERVENTVTSLYAALTRKYYYMPRQQALAEKYLSGCGIDIPNLEELERQSNFILINSHTAFSSPRPYMQNMKNVAGMHLKAAKPLSSDLQKYFESSKNGVILFSLGSAMQSVLMPDFVLQKLKGAFARLPYDVLWKWENDTMADKPKNVRLGKWLPQNDILTHPNLKIFVTHGGMSSIMETVYNGVPIVGMPIFGDQHRNILYAQKKEVGELLDFVTMTEDDIYNVITKVANDPKYRRNIKKISAYWRDEINHPLDEAVHWIEYVYKHNGAKHLKAYVTEQNFIQYFLLDVMFAIFLVPFLTCLLIVKVFRLLCRKSNLKKDLKKTN